MTEAGARASSHFYLDFNLDFAHLASLDGTMNRSGYGGSRITLTDLAGTGSILFEQDTPFTQEPSQISIDQDLMLGPGEYRISIWSSVDIGHLGQYTDASGSGRYDLQFELLSVPEPTTILLLGFVLIGLAGFRRKLDN